ncbi:AAA family ATPase [Streptomyces sp. AcH 505]|uniref:AAA family ATPase n=1 Tax=Streptomyces sp. AcH 505 TaxID=352211 RepID=UPI0005AA5DC7
MIVWLNGTCGAGKTTTARELVPLIPESRIFDSEYVGYMLQHVLDTVPHDDFQEWTPWRGLVVETAAQLLDYVGGTLVVPQTVLVEQYWTEIRTGLEKRSIPVHHFVLHTERDTLVHRIDTDAKEESRNAGPWRHKHLTPYEEALPWLRAEATVLDTTSRTPGQVAREISRLTAAAARQAAGGSGRRPGGTPRG